MKSTFRDLLGFSVCSLSNAAESEIRPSRAGVVSMDEWIDLVHEREGTLDVDTHNFFFFSHFLTSAFLKYCYTFFLSKKYKCKDKSIRISLNWKSSQYVICKYFVMFVTFIFPIC